MSEVVGVIPARLGSTRFPGKLLCPYQGKPLIYYVWRQASRARRIDRLMIATDSAEIARAAEAFGADVVLTSKRPRTGTDRVAEAVKGRPAGIVVNIQGDCFGLKPGLLDRVIDAMMQNRDMRYATLARPISVDQELFNPSVVKVAVGRDGRALWFSRYPIPYLQKPDRRHHSSQFAFLAHIGVYFFRREALEAFVGWKQSPLEKAESLEQLRILDNGGVIKVFTTRSATFSIDTPDDLRKLGQ